MTDLIPAGNGHWTLDMWMLWTAPELRHDQANLTLDAVEDEQHRRKIYGAWRRAENQVVESICKTIGETAPRAFGINTYEVLRQDATLENGMWRNDERLEMTPSLLRDHPQPDWRFPFPPRCYLIAKPRCCFCPSLQRHQIALLLQAHGNGLESSHLPNHFILGRWWLEWRESNGMSGAKIES